EEAGALTGDDVMALAVRHALRTTRHSFWTILAVGHAEAAEEFLQARWNIIETLVAETRGLRAAVQLDTDGDHRRFDLLDDVGKADRRLQLVRLLAQILRQRGRIAARQIEAGSDHERGGAEAGDGGGEQQDAAGSEHAPLLRGLASVGSIGSGI